MQKGRGRPNLGKTASIKQRAVYVYAPTEEMLAEWKKAAEGYGMSLSSFLVEVIDDSVRKNPHGLSPREELEGKLAQVTVQVEGLRKEIESERQLRVSAETELAASREALAAAPSLAADSEMVRRVVGLFRTRMVWKVDEIPSVLGIDPSNGDEVERLIAALDQIKMLGVIEGDFEEVRCQLGRRKKHMQASRKSRTRIRSLKARKRHPAVPGRLPPEGDDPGYGHIVPVEPP